VLLSALKVDVLVHGNATPAEAVAAAKSVVAALGSVRALDAARPAAHARVVCLPPQVKAHAHGERIQTISKTQK